MKLPQKNAKTTQLKMNITLLSVLTLLSCFVNTRSAPTKTLNVIIRYDTDNTNITSDDSPKMFLRGQGFAEISWDDSIECDPVNSTTWKAALTYTEDGTQPQLKVLVDDSTWQVGSNVVVKNSSSTVTIYPWFEKQEGTITYLSQSVQSEKLNNTRPVVLYVPPSYTENKLSVVRNVLIMQDGNNLFDEIASTCVHVVVDVGV